MTRKFFIETFGCQMNVLDSEKIAGSLCCKGMQAVEDPSEADVILLNTCSVRDKAVQKVYARLGELRRRKNERRDLVVGVVGCMAQLEGQKIFQKAPHVDILAGPQKSHVIHSLLEQSVHSGEARIDMRTDDNPSPLEIVPVRRGNQRRASLTISEGCNRQCTYCVVPETLDF